MRTRRRAALYQSAAHCLDYPDAQFHDRIPLLAEAAPALRPFLDHARATDPAELAQEYVRVFDFHNKHCLHLTWWLDGDTRRRGQSLIEIKQTYREHGMTLDATELPDYLPVVLEFMAAIDDQQLLLAHRPGLELLRIALQDAGTPYATVVSALCATLPGASPRDRAAARALARSGPRSEDVGLVPYGHLDLLPVLVKGEH